MFERFKDYNTNNPHYKRFDLLKIDNRDKRNEAERQTHRLLEQVGIAHCNHNDEWFLVSKETYFEIKEKGFKFFFD